MPPRRLTAFKSVDEEPWMDFLFHFPKQPQGPDLLRNISQHLSYNQQQSFYPMPYCKDGRFHWSQAEADACRHHPADKDFATVNLTHPPLSTGKPDIAINGETEDAGSEEEYESGDLPVQAPITPLSKQKTKTSSKSSSPSAGQQGYPTPPFTQQMEDIGDNIVVASSSPAGAAGAARRRSPAPTPACGTQMASSRESSAAPDDDQDDFDDILGPLSSTPSVRSPSPAQAPSNGTTCVPETELEDTTLINNDGVEDDDDDDDADQNLADLQNSLLTLRADRAHLIDALHDSTFHVQRLQTRGRIQRINTALAQLQGEEAVASARTAWDLAEKAREASWNSSMSLWLAIAIMVAYGLWCVWMSAEMAYIRSRRCKWYGLRKEC